MVAPFSARRTGMSHIAVNKPRSWGPRQGSREAVSLAAALYGFACSRSVIIIEMSAHGGRLRGRDLPAPGEDVVLVVGSSEVIGKVVWRLGDQCGFQFDDVLADATIACMKAEAEWESVAGWYR
jgi:hypothetical protein